MTPRQQLIERVANHIAMNNYEAYRIAQNDPTEETKRHMQRTGMQYTVMPYTINDLYSTGLGQDSLQSAVEDEVTKANNPTISKYYQNQTDRAFERFCREAFNKATMQFNHMKNHYLNECMNPRDDDEQHVMDTISRSRVEDGYYLPADAVQLSADETFVSQYRARVDSDLAGFYQYDETLNADAVKRLLARGVLRISHIDTGVVGNMPPRKQIERTRK